jgi:hypothetical protein
VRGLAALAIAVLGCGRVGFDARAPSDAATDASLPPSFAGLCALPTLTVIQDGFPADNTSAHDFANGVASACATGQTIRAVDQGSAGILEATTQRPLLAVDELGIMGGGDNSQDAMQYLLAEDSPLVFAITATAYNVVERSSGSTVFSAPPSSLSDLHDLAIVMLIREAVSGGTYVDLYGVNTNGVVAAEYYVSTVIAPMLAADGHQWYVVEWTDVNSNGPDAADTFNLVASH